MTPTVRASKAALRGEIAGQRAALTPAQLDVAGEKLAAALLPALEAARCVACYVDVPPEPPTGLLLAALRAADVRLLLPILRADRDLGWGEYDSRAGLVTARFGLREPAGQDLGVEAIRDADVVIVPAVGVGRDGIRLGRGGGSYDRALTRTSDAALVVALLHDGELLPAGTVPAEPHDRRLHGVATPTGGLVRLP